MKEFKFKFKVSEEEYVRLIIWATFEKNYAFKIFNKYLVYIFGAFILFVCFVANLSPIFYGIVIIMTLSPIFTKFVVKKNAKKSFKANNNIQNNIVSITVNSDYLEDKVGENYLKVKWINLFKIYETFDMYIILADSIHVSVIHKKYLTQSQLTFLRKTIKDKVQKDKIKLLKV